MDQTDTAGTKEQLSLEPLVTIDDVVAYLGVPKDTLYGWNHRRVGPLAAKVGKHLRYRRSDVDAWLDEQAIDRVSGG